MLIEKQMSTLTKTLALLESDYKMLEDAKHRGGKEAMFVAEKKVSKNLPEYESVVLDMETGYIRPTVSFERNKKLVKLLTDVNALGNLKSVKVDYLRGKKMMLEMKIQSSSCVDVQSSDNEEEIFITGCAFMPNGHVVLCNFLNHTIILLDGSFSVTGDLRLPSAPSDVSVIDRSNIIVTLPDTAQLQYIQVFPDRKTGRSIQLDKKCWGIDVSGEEIYISCHNDPGEGEIRVLDLNGQLKRKISVSQDGSFRFTNPYYLAVSTSRKKIFVSDDSTYIVTCMTLNGDIIYQYQDNDLRSPGGLVVDTGDNVFVCGYATNTIHVITSDGRKSYTLDCDEIERPSSMTFRDNDSMLIVGCNSQSPLIVYKLD